MKTQLPLTTTGVPKQNRFSHFFAFDSPCCDARPTAASPPWSGPATLLLYYSVVRATEKRAHAHGKATRRHEASQKHALSVAPPLLEEGGAATHRYGLVLDLHFMQKAALEFGLTTLWRPELFEKLLLSALDKGREAGGRTGQIIARFAADSLVATGPKCELQKRLEKGGYVLELSPNKRTRLEQGATDVVIACLLHELAGAFESCPLVDEIVLVSGDSDFWPCLARLLARRPSLRVCVCATGRKALRKEYLRWLQSEACAKSRFVELRDVLQGMGGACKLNFENLHRWKGNRPSYDDVIKQVDARLRQLNTGLLALNLSFNNHLWGDGDMERLCLDLITRMQANHKLPFGQLWVHHTNITDDCCEVLAELIRHAQYLSELHISDTQITERGLALLVAACAGREGCSGQQLYINVSHVTPSPELSTALDLGPRVRSRSQYPTRSGAAMVRLQGQPTPKLAATTSPLRRNSSFPAAAASPSRRKERGGEARHFSRHSSPTTPSRGASPYLRKGKCTPTRSGKGNRRRTPTPKKTDGPSPGVANKEEAASFPD